MSLRGDDLDRTSTSQKGSGSRHCVIGAGRLAWMVSFGWNIICACIRLLNVHFSVVLTYRSEVMMCDFLNGMEIVSFLDLIPENRTSMPRHLPGTPYPLPLPGPPRLPSGWRGSPPTLYRSAF